MRVTNGHHSAVRGHRVQDVLSGLPANYFQKVIGNVKLRKVLQHTWRIVRQTTSQILLAHLPFLLCRLLIFVS